MKIKFRLFLIIIFMLGFIPSGMLWAQGVSSNELIKNAKAYDGKLVVYTGEVIGDVMRRGQFAWINLNDGDNALGVWVDAALIKNLNFTGNYKSQGDVLEVAGQFHAACLEHGGDLDLHAQALRLVNNGRFTKRGINFAKIKLSLILLGVLFFIWILNIFKQK